MTDVLTSTGTRTALTEAELQYLQSFLDAGDRGGFYMAYYALVVADDPLLNLSSGSEFGKLEASLQTKIATFSGAIGATAYLSNRLLEEAYPQQVYPGIYYISQEVAESALAFMRADLSAPVEGADDGLISDETFFQSARQAWEGLPVDLSPQFPGLLLGTNAGDAIANTGAVVLAYVAWLASYGGEHGALPGREEILAWIKTYDPARVGATAAALTTLYVSSSGITGKQVGDYQGLSGYTIIESPDDNQRFVVNAEGHIVAAEADPMSNGSSQYEDADFIMSQLRSSVQIASTLGQFGVTTVDGLAATLSTLFQPHLPSSWIDLTYPVGESRPSNVVNDATPTAFRSEATGGNDTLVGTATTLGLGGGDTIHAQGGDDAVFGGGGEDRLFGDGGNDILWGHEQDDELHGGVGNDVMRGGSGNDLLRPGMGADIVDGGSPDVDRAADGVDTADYSDLTNFSWVSITLGGENPLYAQDGVVFVADSSGTDILTSVERIIGTDYADLIRITANGAALFNQLEWIDLGRHVGVPNSEGRQIDTIDISEASSAVYVDLRDLENQVATIGPLGAPLRLRNVEGVVGSHYNDVLFAVARGDALNQGSAINGGSGADNIFGGAGNDRLSGDGDNDYIDGGRGTNILDGGSGFDRIVSRGRNDIILRAERTTTPGAAARSAGGGGDDEDRMFVAMGSTTTVENASVDDRLFFADFLLTGGVQAWWNESGVAANAPFTNLAYAYPSIGAELLAVGAILADAPSMKFAMYRQEQNGDIKIAFGYGLGGTATIKNYQLDLSTGQGTAGLTLFRQGGRGRTASVDQGTGNYVNLALYAGYGRGLPGFDPLVLDLDGDGFEVTAREYSQVYFDFEANGFAKQSGWVSGDDAFLTRDLNSNGLVDDGSELFGNRGQSGFAALGALDSNADGAINAGDVGFESLRLWRDLNQDGVSQETELQSLSEAGVSSISLTAAESPTGTEIRNNVVARTAQFARSDGTTGSVGDITFDVSDLNTRWTGTGDASAAAEALPQLGGLGLTRDLRLVMTDDGQLLSMVNDFATNSGASLASLLGQVEAITYRWAGVDGAAPISIGANDFDTRKLAFLEKYTGVQLLPRDANGAVSATANTASVEELWNYEFPRLALKLLAQGPLASVFEGLAYHEEIDQFVAAAPGTITSIIDRVLDGMPTTAAEAQSYWTQWGELLGAIAGTSLRSTGANVGPDFFFTQLVAAVDGRPLPLTITQMAATLAIDGIHIGSQGALTRTAGDAGTQIWFADQANATANGGTGQDAYVFGQSIGNAVITDIEGEENGDRIRFAFLNAADVTMARDGNDLLITITATNETVRVVGQYAPVTLLGSDNIISSNKGVEDIQFADGTIMEASEIAIAIGKGTSGDDLLAGSMHTDVLQGGMGNDTLEGGDDADLYYVNANEGHDIIRDRQSTPSLRGMDMLLFGEGIGPEDLQFSRVSSDLGSLLITIGDTGDSVLVDGQFGYTSLGYDGMFAANSRIEIFAFRNYAETWSESQIRDLLIQQTTTESADTTYGFGGSDVFHSSAGNDVLVGLDGADTYEWGIGSGNDTIDERAYYIDVAVGLGGISLIVRADTVILGEGITHDNIVFTSNLATPDLLISSTTSSDTLIVKDQFAGFQTGVLGAQWFNRIEWFEFADGSRISWQEVLADVTTGGSGDDQLRGDLFADRLDGGAGDDYLSGKGVGDTYVFNLGYGHDTIDDANSSFLGEGFITIDESKDVLQLGPGITTADLRFERNGANVDIVIGTAGDRVTLFNQDSYIQTGVFGALSTNRVEEIRFADGTVWSWQQLNANILASFTTASDDVALGFTLEDRFEASAGNDILMGGESGDTYVFGVGSGNDIIREGVGNVLYGDEDTIEFAGSILPGDVSLIREGDDLTLRLATGDSIKIEGEFAYQAGFTWADVERFEFTNGTVWTKEYIQERILAEQNTSGNDTILGFGSDDILDGGAGNDILKGGEGSDTYKFDRGYGNDQVTEERWNQNLSEYDRVQLGSGITESSVTLRRVGNDLTLSLDTGETLTVVSHFVQGPLQSTTFNDVEEIRFTDGVVWDKAVIANRYFNATAGDDTFIGTWDDQTVAGLAGDDRLEGDRGADRYLYNLGDGHDTIVDASGGTNRIVFGEGIASTDIRLTNNPADSSELLITFASAPGSIRVLGQWTDNAIEAFDFVGEDSWTFEQISAAFMVGQSTPSSDSIFGTRSDDIIDGGGGDDSLVGYAGDDIYRFGRGDGSDTIFDRGAKALIGYDGGGNDAIELDSDITPNDVEVVQLNSNDLALRISGTTDQIVMLGSISDPSVRIEQVRFTGGFVWNYETMLAATLLGTSGDDTISAGTTPSTIGGRDGNDTLSGSEYDDTVIGGTGNDILRGGGGNDLYRFSRGDGQDTILDRGAPGIWGDNEGGFDTIEFAAGIGPGHLEVVQVNETDLMIKISGTTDQILMQGALGNTIYRIDQVRFTDSPSWSYADILSKSQIPTDGNDTIRAGFTASTLTGAGGDDTLTGSIHDDVLDGGAGNDTLYGGGGNDTYRLVRGAGSDTIIDQGPNGLFGATDGGLDTIEFGPDITPSQVEVYQVNANDLAIRISATGDQFIMAGAISGTVPRIEYAKFGDGTIWDYQTMLAATQLGTSGNDMISAGTTPSMIGGRDGNDTLTGSEYDDILIGGTGNDMLRGGGGNDLYRFSRGDGEDIILDRGAPGTWGDNEGGFDTIEFAAGINPGDIQVVQVNETDLMIKISGTTDQILMQGALGNTIYRIDQIKFADSPPWSYADILSKSQIPTDGNDTIYAGFTSSNLSGAGGNDILNGSTGNDILNGGTGNDRLSGYSGDDVYRFGAGDGVDTVDDHGLGRYWGYEDGGVDRVDLRDGLFENNVRITQISADDVAIDIIGTSDRLILSGQLSTPARAVEMIRFADGTEWSAAQIFANSLIPTSGDDVIYAGSTPSTLLGAGGNDILAGSTGNDILDGGTGTDRLSGYSGDDVYRFGVGDGVDTVDDHGLARYWGYEDGGVDRVELRAGLFENNVRVTQISADDVAIDIIGTSDRLILSGQLSTPARAVETIRFADGTEWSAAQIFENSLIPTSGDDVIYAGSTPSTLTGGFGNDRLNGSVGADVLQGDDGNDQLEGYSGDDTYRYSADDGSDTINDHGYARYWGYEDGGVDRLELTGVNQGDFGVFAANGGADIVLVFNQSNDAITIVGAGNDAAQRIETIRFGDGSEWTHANLISHLNGTYSSGNNIIMGAAGDDWLRGAAGNDTVASIGGSDLIEGDEWSDILHGSEGDDTLNGGTGIDIANYVAASAGVSVNFTNASPQGTVGAGTDAFTGIQNLTGSAFAVALVGDANANTFRPAPSSEAVASRPTEGLLEKLRERNLFDEPSRWQDWAPMISEFAGDGIEKFARDGHPSRSASTSNLGDPSTSTENSQHTKLYSKEALSGGDRNDVEGHERRISAMINDMAVFGVDSAARIELRHANGDRPYDMFAA